MLLARLELDGGRRLVTANLHATASRGDHVAATGGRARRRARGRVGRRRPARVRRRSEPRPETAPAAFEALTGRLGLGPPTGPKAIDHLLARGLEVVEAPQAAPSERRELTRGDGLRIRLSDHAPVFAAFGMK